MRYVALLRAVNVGGRKTHVGTVIDPEISAIDVGTKAWDEAGLSTEN